MTPSQALTREFTVRTANSSDVDEQAALLTGWNQNYLQLSPGRFAGSLMENCVDGVRVFIESTSRSLLQGGMLDDDVIAVGVPLRMTGPAMFCGTKVPQAGVFVFSGRDGFEFRSPPGLVMSGIAIPSDALRDLLTAEEREQLVPTLSRAHVAKVGETTHDAMRQFAVSVADLAARSARLADDPSLRGTLRKSILSNVAQLLLGCRFDQDPAVRERRRWQIVAQVRELVHARACEPLSIADVCKAVGVSRRTLQYCFENTLGASPHEFLRAVRLNGARRMLRTAPSVTDAAMQFGFWHLGYFSQDYRELFGELPSQTRRRYQGSASGASR